MGGVECRQRLRTLQIALGQGFRGQSVVVSLDGREVFRGTGLTTDPTTSRAALIETAVASRLTTVSLRVEPADIGASFDFDVSEHPLVAIHLVGGATISFETFR